jgi:hypothetical protein
VTRTSARCTFQKSTMNHRGCKRGLRPLAPGTLLLITNSVAAFRREFRFPMVAP